MKIKNVNLEWNVLLWDCNKKKVINYNVLNDELIKRLHKDIVTKKTIKTYNQLKENIKRWFMYHYWSKCEFEIVVGDWPTCELDTLEKIDAYRQIEMNLDRITEYLIKELNIKF